LNVTGNTTSGNLLTPGQVSAVGNVTGAYLLGNISAATGAMSRIANTTSSVSIPAAGGNVAVAVNVDTVATFTTSNLLVNAVSGYGVVASGNIVGGNLTTAGQSNLANIRVSGDTITGTNGIVKVNSALGDIDFAVSGLTANIFYVYAGANTASFGNNTQTTNALVAFNATNSILIPVGNTAQRPATGVAGMVRYNSTTTGVEVYNGTSWSALGSSFTSITTETFNGDGATTSFTLSSANFTTDSVIVTLNGVVQQPAVAYAVSGTSLVFTEAPATGDVIVVRELQTTTSVGSISSGTSSLGISTASGNAFFTIGGISNVMTVSTSGVDITGNLTVSGNATLSGNIMGDRIQNGTTTIDIQSASGNANITVAATSNVAVFTTGGLNLAGVLSATGNVIGGNLNASGLSLSGNVVSALNVTGNVTAGNIITVGAMSITGASTAASYSATGNVTGGNLTTGGQVSSTGNITGGNILGGANVNATTHTGATVNVTGNIDGGNLRTAGLISSTGTVTGSQFNGSGAGLTSIPGANVTGTVPSATSATSATTATTAGTVTTAAQGNITSVGTLTGLTINNAIIAITNGGANGVGNIGSSTGYFNTVFAKATSAQYADLAEKYTADADYAPGTVVEFGGAAEVTLSVEPDSTRIAGVISTKPSYIMNATLTSAHVATVALQGRVPCKVIGPVSKGDMMVAAGNGYAKVDNNARAGTIIGKALDTLHDPYGVIEVVVGRN